MLQLLMLVGARSRWDFGDIANWSWRTWRCASS